ncbi:HdeD family acid-resistance protein [Pseudovibrio exalbescens]|nr:HdeD family acid-resistance protein [Pseudovibrio exalbescens]
MTQNQAGHMMAPSMTQMVIDKWGRFLALGVLLVIGGMVVIAMPLASSIAIALVIAAVLVIGGAIQLWHAFSVKEWSGFLWQLITGVIAIIGGGAVYYNPAFGTAALTLVLAAVFIIQGISQVMFSLKLKPHDGWGWILTAGTISLLAGLCIFFEFPLSAAWALGLIVGISIIFNGWSYIAIALTARAVSKAQQTPGHA